MIRPESRFWFGFFTFSSTVIAIYLSNKLPIDASYEYKGILITAVASLISAVSFLAFDVAIDRLMNMHAFRSRIDRKRSQFEGEYIEFYKDSKDEKRILYAYFRIRYTSNSTSPYLIKGSAYDSDGRSIAIWDSNAVNFYPDSGDIEYFYSGEIFETYELVRGIGTLNFKDETSYAVLPILKDTKRHGRIKHRTRFNCGTGYFVDSVASRNKFHFVRVTDDIVKRVIGDQVVNNLDAERLFIISFHKYFGERIIEKDYLLFDKMGDLSNRSLP